MAASVGEVVASGAIVGAVAHAVRARAGRRRKTRLRLVMLVPN
jgi:hypothetical protein